MVIFFSSVKSVGFNCFASGMFRAFRAKTTGLHMALRERNSGTERGRELFKGSKDSASLVVCNEKSFWLEFVDFL